MSRPAPPRLAPRPGKVMVVRAMYPYNAQAADELSFDEGDLLYIIDRVSSKEWWKARSGDKEGLIPSNYVGENTESIDTPLHDAAKRGNIQFLKECIQNQVSVNGLDKAGSSPLHWACNGGHLDCIDVLIQANCKVDIKNKLGDTPLHAAAWKNHLQAIEKLLEKGAPLDVVNNDGKRPMDMAHDPACSALLRAKTQPRNVSMEEYGDEEDSD